MPQYLKIVIPYSQFLDKERSGGVGTYIKNVALTLADCGHAVTILTSGRGTDIQLLPNLKIVRIAEVESFLKNSQYFSLPYICRRLSYMWALWRYVRDNRPDIMECSDGGFEHLFALLFGKSNCITFCHGNLTDHCNLMFSSLLDLIERFVLFKSSALISPTSSNSEHLSKKFGVPRHRFKEIPNGLNSETRFKRVDVRQAYGLGSQKIVLFVGVHSLHKGIDLFVNLARQFDSHQYRGLVFVSIGRAGSSFSLENPPGNYHQTGFITRDELYSFYSESNLFVSSARFETFGYGPVEAMSLGLPVLVSDCIGTRDVIQPGPGRVFFRSGSQVDLNAKFESLLDSSGITKAAYPENIYQARQFNIQLVTRMRLMLYYKLLASGRPGG